MNELLLEKYAYKKKKPVLLPYLDDIKILLEHDATQKSVLEYLKNEKGITVSQPYLSKFISQYIYGDKTIDPQVKSIQKKLNDETTKQKQSDKIDPNENLENSSKEIATVLETEKEMSKAERDALVEEWVKNNQNILARPKR
jgi:hypothetical protein